MFEDLFRRQKSQSNEPVKNIESAKYRSAVHAHNEIIDARKTREEVDRHSAVISSALESKGKIYKKKGEMHVRFSEDGDVAEQYEVLPDSVKEELREMSFDPTSLQGKRGEFLITRLASGKLETPHAVSPGNPIVKNLGGEEYAPEPDVFAKRYEPKEGVEGVYIAKGYCVAVENPYGEPIVLKAEWGEMQNGDADCMIADIYDKSTGKRGGEPYIIERAAFKQTYAPES